VVQAVVFGTLAWPQSLVPLQVPTVQGLPLSQLASLTALTQPVAGTHESSVQLTLSSQSSALPATQTPRLVSQVSAPLHILLSLQSLLEVQPTVQVPP
jgi:hypothetical protein